MDEHVYVAHFATLCLYLSIGKQTEKNSNADSQERWKNTR